MLDRAAVPIAFPELDSPTFLAESGQKYVFRGRRGAEEVVLKIFKAGQEQKRIDREIQAVAQLSCDYVPPVLASGQRTIDGKMWSFLVERFVAGESYRAVLQRTPVQSLREVLPLGEALLRACCDFEAEHMVHRDIKPENLICGRDGKLWVIDFGIVRLLRLTSATQTQQRFGLFTPGYGAPEQVRNLKPKIDIKADLFSVGVVLYEALHGANPYRAGKHNELEVIQHVCNWDLPPLVLSGDSEGKLSELIGALTARFPSRRPQTAQEALLWWQEVAANLS